MHATFYRCFDRLLGSWIINEFLNDIYPSISMWYLSKSVHYPASPYGIRTAIVDRTVEYTQRVHHTQHHCKFHRLKSKTKEKYVIKATRSK